MPKQLHVVQDNHQPDTDYQQRIAHALRGATQGIAAAMEQDSITPTQVDCLLTTLIEQLESTLC